MGGQGLLTYKQIIMENENPEAYLMREIDAVDESTFMYQLHEQGVFDKAKFLRLISKADELTKSDDGMDDYNALLCGLADCFLYIMSSLYYHLDSNDVYVIENYGDIKNDVPEYIDKMRDVLRKLILY